MHATIEMDAAGRSVIDEALASIDAPTLTEAFGDGASDPFERLEFSLNALIAGFAALRE